MGMSQEGKVAPTGPTIGATIDGEASKKTMEQGDDLNDEDDNVKSKLAEAEKEIENLKKELNSIQSEITSENEVKEIEKREGREERRGRERGEGRGRKERRGKEEGS